MKRLGDVLREVEKQLPPAVKQLIEVDRVWDKIMNAVGVPPRLSKPLFIWGGYLHVAVKTPSVGQTIGLKSEDIVVRLRQMGIEISGLRFHVGRRYFAQPSNMEERHTDPCMMPPEDLIAEAEKELDDVDEPEIKRRLAILIARGRCKNG
jgi:hypothetical protein